MTPLDDYLDAPVGTADLLDELGVRAGLYVGSIDADMPVRIGPGVIKPDVVRPPGTGKPGIIKKPTPVMPKRPGQ